MLLGSIQWMLLLGGVVILYGWCAMLLAALDYKGRRGDDCGWAWTLSLGVPAVTLVGLIFDMDSAVRFFFSVRILIVMAAAFGGGSWIDFIIRENERAAAEERAERYKRDQEKKIAAELDHVRRGIPPVLCEEFCGSYIEVINALQKGHSLLV